MSMYYKILPEDLNCRGFQYHEGLNIDSKEITPYMCENGLHFADAEHILNFCNYGQIIAEVELPEDAVVYHFCNQSKADKIILKNLRPLWSIETVEALIREDVEFESYMNHMLYEAAKYGYLDIVKYLVEHGANIHDSDYDTVCCASKYGHLEIVEYLVEHGANIYAWDDYPLRWASYNGHLDVVKYLVEQGSNIHTGHDFALREASSSGHLDVVKYLIEQGANIHAQDDEALFSASKYGHLDVVKYLVEQGANIHAYNNRAIRYAKTPEIKAYLKSIK